MNKFWERIAPAAIASFILMGTKIGHMALDSSNQWNILVLMFLAYLMLLVSLDIAKWWIKR